MRSAFGTFDLVFGSPAPGFARPQDRRLNLGVPHGEASVNDHLGVERFQQLRKNYDVTSDVAAQLWYLLKVTRRVTTQ
jgi:hypothetical protein